jgi:hypothetical protein
MKLFLLSVRRIKSNFFKAKRPSPPHGWENWYSAEIDPLFFSGGWKVDGNCGVKNHG